MIYYTSDQHFYHYNILKLTNRPYKTIEEMNTDIIKKWNAKVKPNDDVYILGDMFYKAQDIQQIQNVLKSLNGKKHLIRGNHDKFLNQLNWRDYFEEVVFYKEISDNNRMVCMFHYPIEEWNGYFRNSYMLYGHVHGNDQDIKKHKRKFNVGVDVNDFEPKTLDELIEKNKGACDYYTQVDYIDWEEDGTPTIITLDECTKFKECRSCTCGGDEKKCDYYKDKRNL